MRTFGRRRSRPPGPARAALRDLPWVALGLGTLLALFFVDPATSSLFPPCPVHWATGYACPGCGSGRALHALLHGSVGRAFSLNPLAVLALPVMALGFAGLARTRWIGGMSDQMISRRASTSLRARTRSRLAWGVLGGLLLWAVVRNLVGWTP